MGTIDNYRSPVLGGEEAENTPGNSTMREEDVTNFYRERQN